MLLLALACRAPQTPSGTTVVRFEPSAPALGAVPFPSDLFRDDDGRIALGPLPNPLDGSPKFDAIRELLASREGFCATCAIWFGLSAPPVLPEQTAGLPDDPVVVMDLDTGATLPLDLAWDPSLGLLSARPVRGRVLAAGHRHVAFVTSALIGDDGLPVAPDVPFSAVRERSPEADPHALSVLGPALDALASRGITDVIGLASFVPEDPRVDLFAIQQIIAGHHEARPVVDRVYLGSEIDSLLGTPGEDRPGIDVAPAEGTLGSRSIRHATTAIVVAGHFAAPRFLEGEGTDLGLVARGVDGAPVSLTDDQVPFVLIVPEGADVTHLPVVIEHHGFSASRTTAFVLADTAGAAGFAVLGIDAYQHGARAPSASDTVHAMRGDLPGADGFAETASLEVTGRVFGLLGPPIDLSMYPGYPLAAFTQFAADVLSTVDLVQGGDWSEVAGVDPALAGLAFDPAHLVFVGNSMGSVVGTQVVAADEQLGATVGAAVLDVLPGGIVDTLCESGEFRSLSESVLLPAIGVQGPFDEIERELARDPTVDLMRWVLEPVDPLALAPFLVREGGPELLIQLAGHDEVAAPGPSEAVVAAAGVQGVGTFGFAEVQPAVLPASVVAVRRDGAMHQMLELLDQSSVWLEPLAPPLAQRPEPSPVENPIEEVHDEILLFLESQRETGRAVLP